MLEENKIDYTHEVWKSVVGYEDYYEVSNFGRIKSIKRTITAYNPRFGWYKKIVNEKFMAIKFNLGYKVTKLSKGGITKDLKIHRLIALAFIPNPQNKPYINHIDGVKTNNSISNLEWCTLLENNHHAFINGLSAYKHLTPTKSKLVVNLENGVFYDSIREAAKSIPVKEFYLRDSLAGKRVRYPQFIYA